MLHVAAKQKTYHTRAADLPPPLARHFCVYSIPVLGVIQEFFELGEIAHDSVLGDNHEVFRFSHFLMTLPEKHFMSFSFLCYFLMTVINITRHEVSRLWHFLMTLLKKHVTSFHCLRRFLMTLPVKHVMSFSNLRHILMTWLKKHFTSIPASAISSRLCFYDFAARWCRIEPVTKEAHTCSRFSRKTSPTMS